jgi:transposase
MSGIRRRHSAAFKAKAALEAMKGEKTMSQLSGEYGVHPNQTGQWKKKALSELPDIFSRGRQKKILENEALQSELYRQIGQLKVELDWLKKKSVLLTG